jgi:hypothetical protein
MLYVLVIFARKKGDNYEKGFGFGMLFCVCDEFNCI